MRTHRGRTPQVSFIPDSDVEEFIKHETETLSLSRFRSKTHLLNEAVRVLKYSPLVASLQAQISELQAQVQDLEERCKYKTKCIQAENRFRQALKPRLCPDCSLEFNIADKTERNV